MAMMASFQKSISFIFSYRSDHLNTFLKNKTDAGRTCQSGAHEYGGKMNKSVAKCHVAGWIIGFVLLLVAFSIPVHAQTDGARVGQVTILEGAASVLRSGQTAPQPLTVGSAIYQNDAITTDTGQLRIKFNDDSIVSVGSNSNLKINQYVYRPESRERAGSLDLLWGKIKCYVKDLTGFSRRSFDVSTPTAIIGVRGTTYIVDAPQGEGRTLAANLKGSVYAANVDTPGDEIGLPGETYTEVREGLRPEEPAAITPALMLTLHQGLLSLEFGLTSAAAGTSAATTVPTITTVGAMVGVRVAGLAVAVDDAGKKERDGDLFTVTISSGGDSYSREFAHVEQIIKEFRGKTIKNYLPNFNDQTSPFSGIVDFRGLPMYLEVGANSNTFHLRIPEIGLDESFSGSTRDDSLDALEDWMKDNNNDVLTKIAKWCAKNTATDPVAGNPSSMMGRMVSGAFDSGFANQVSALRSNNMIMAEHQAGPAANPTVIASSGQYHPGRPGRKFRDVRGQRPVLHSGFLLLRPALGRSGGAGKKLLQKSVGAGRGIRLDAHRLGGRILLHPAPVLFLEAVGRSPADADL